MRDYETPETPDGTPPVVDPAKKRRQGAERSSDNKRSENDRAAERALAPAQEGGRDGAGEADLDKSRSD